MSTCFLLSLFLLLVLCGGLSSSRGGGAPASLAFPASVATVRRNGVDVHVVGTIHSTPSSARDVEEAVRIAQPSHVVLELCGSRWCRLLNGAARERAGEEGRDGNPFVRWFRSSVKEGRRSGAAPALLSAGLSLPYATMRASRSGSFRPGGEFLSSVDAAAAAAGQPPQSDVPPPPPAVVLGDVDAAETVAALAAAMSLRPYAGRDWEESLAHARRQFGVVGRALGFGGDDRGLDLMSVLGRGPTLRDLSVLLFPALFLLAGVEVALGDSQQLDIERQLENFIVVINVLLSAWAVAAAPDAIAVMLDLRDDALACSIDHACRGARLDRSHPGPPAVVAVVGLFHVNGIVPRLSRPEWSGPKPSYHDWGEASRLQVGRLLVASETMESSSFCQAVLLLLKPVRSDAAGGSSGWTAVRLDQVDDGVKSGRRIVGCGGPCASRAAHKKQDILQSDAAKETPVERERFRIHRSVNAAQQGDIIISDWGGSPLVISNETYSGDAACIELDGCAAWWPGQLEAETACGDWHVVDTPADASDALFGSSSLNETSLSWEKLVLR